MGKQIIRLTENDLHKIIKSSTERILNEMKFGDNELSNTPFNTGFNKDKEDINTKEGYVKFLILKLMRDGMNPNEAVNKAFEEANKRFK